VVPSSRAPAAADPSFLALQAAVAGRFSLESELGRGGMGIVYLARDVLLERPVAIKLLAPSLGAHADMRRRFLREARIAAQCFHPHIVPIHEVAESGDLAWFVMAYVHGETLADRLRRVGTLPADAIRRIGREVGWALGYAHERGVVHRDVKPENILLEHGTDRALIADFGIAWRDSAAGGEHVSGEVAGTARFMAPEQAMGDTVDGRADLYALGVTLFVAATGQYPFDGGNALAIVAQQAIARAPSVRTRAPQLPTALADAIDQCLAPHPCDRFASASAFVSAIERTPSAVELPPEAIAVRRASSSMLSLASWTVSIGAASAFLILGEREGSLGRGLMVGFVQGIIAVGVAAMAMRGAEALVLARRALQRGVAPSDLADALAPASDELPSRMTWWQSAALLGAGAALAVAQNQVDTLRLPEALEFIATLLTFVVPPVLMHRALAFQRKASGFTAFFHERVRKPVAARLVRLLGGADADAPARPQPANAPTEVLLGQAADAIFARLPNDAQRNLRALPAATAALAREAIALRARDLEISREQRLARVELRDEPALRALDDERAAVQGRLGTTIAALEAIRLDLLRLDGGLPAPDGLTDHLDVVRELQRRVDAIGDVQRALSPLAPEPTPV
jgi:serine/threonine-protein kinase